VVAVTFYTTCKIVCNLCTISGSITLLAVAPLTNIAVALLLDASFGHKLKNCVIMGGNYTGGCHFFLLLMLAGYVSFSIKCILGTVANLS